MQMLPESNRGNSIRTSPLNERTFRDLRDAVTIFLRNRFVPLAALFSATHRRNVRSFAPVRSAVRVSRGIPMIQENYKGERNKGPRLRAVYPSFMYFWTTYTVPTETRGRLRLSRRKFYNTSQKIGLGSRKTIVTRRHCAGNVNKRKLP